MLDTLLATFPGWKAAITGVGQVAFGVYQITQGNLEAGIALIAAGVGLLFESVRN